MYALILLLFKFLILVLTETLRALAIIMSVIRKFARSILSEEETRLIGHDFDMGLWQISFSTSDDLRRDTTGSSGAVTVEQRHYAAAMREALLSTATEDAQDGVTSSLIRKMTCLPGGKYECWGCSGQICSVCR